MIVVASNGLSEKDLTEVFVQEAVDSEVHQAVQDQEQVIGRCGANEPSWRDELIFTSNHFIDVVELIEVEEDSWEVSDEEHADNDQQDQGKVKIFGLLQIKMILIFEHNMTVSTQCADFYPGTQNGIV